MKTQQDRVRKEAAQQKVKLENVVTRKEGGKLNSLKDSDGAELTTNYFSATLSIQPLALAYTPIRIHFFIRPYSSDVSMTHVRKPGVMPSQ